MLVKRKHCLIYSDLLRLFLILLRILLIIILVVLVIVVVVLFLVLLLVVCFLGLVLLLFLAFLYLAQLLPLLPKAVRLSLVIGDDNVVKDRAALYLPQIESKESEIVILVHLVIVHVLRIRDLFRLPDALVCGIRDPLDIPIALVGRIVLHRRLPFTILLVIPIVRLLGIAVHDALLLYPH